MSLTHSQHAAMHHELQSSATDGDFVVFVFVFGSAAGSGEIGVGEVYASRSSSRASRAASVRHSSCSERGDENEQSTRGRRGDAGVYGLQSSSSSPTTITMLSHIFVSRAVGDVGVIASDFGEGVRGDGVRERISDGGHARTMGGAPISGGDAVVVVSGGVRVNGASAPRVAPRCRRPRHSSASRPSAMLFPISEEREAVRGYEDGTRDAEEASNIKSSKL